MVTLILVMAAVGVYLLLSPWWAIVLLVLALCWEVCDRMRVFEPSGPDERPARVSDGLTVIVLLLVGCSLGFVMLIQLLLWLWVVAGYFIEAGDKLGRLSGWW